MKKIEKITMVYFTGTGGTGEVAACIEEKFKEKGLQVIKKEITQEKGHLIEETDLVIILAPVYALRIASIMEKWVSHMSEVSGTYAAVISVSGGGEVSPNTACRLKTKRLLKKKGYELIYEEMLVMPSNFTVHADEQMNLDIIRALPRKAERIARDILAGKRRIKSPKVLDRFLAPLGMGEHVGAKVFGSCMHATDACNQCGLCVRGCPVGNIRLNDAPGKNGRPKYGFRCIWCMKCIYNCPQKALVPGMGKFVVLKQGFPIRKMVEEAKRSPEESGRAYTPNILFQGVVDYLKED